MKAPQGAFGVQGLLSFWAAKRQAHCAPHGVLLRHFSAPPPCTSPSTKNSKPTSTRSQADDSPFTTENITDNPEANPLKSRADIAKAARLSSSQVVQIEKIQKQAAPELVAAIKAGAISINAAAAVASLPAEEQKKPA